MSAEKYAVGEYERRFLLDAVPPGTTDPRRIVDRYLDRTRLRLRTVEHPTGHVDRKLGHKRRIDDSDPTGILHTSLYLDVAELDVLATLPGRVLVKTRWAIDLAGRTGAVDVFEGRLAGLILLEADLGDPDRLDGFSPPAWAGPEVTNDEAFTGGRLAGTSLDLLGPALTAATGREGHWTGP